MRKVLRSRLPTLPIGTMQFAALLTGAIAVMAIAADKSYAQGHYSARTTRAQPAASSGGLFGNLFGGGAPRYRTPYSSTYGSHNSYGYYNPNGSYNRSYQGYGRYGERGYGRYRTLCVRTCDGYYYPMSYSTTRVSFVSDDKQCRSSCAVPARLFVYRNPGAGVEHMVDLQGKPYSQMENAFRYRKEYVKECRCKPEPWSEEAKMDYASREEAASAQVKTANVAEQGAQAAAAPESAAFSEGQFSQARAQSSRRRRYRRYEARRYDGHWWAGSW